MELKSIAFSVDSIVGAGIAVLSLPVMDAWYGVGSAAAAYGLCLGCWYLLMPVLLADMFGTERISSSYGLTVGAPYLISCKFFIFFYEYSVSVL